MNVKVFGMEPAKGVIPIFSNYNIQSGNIAEDSVVEYINYDKLTPAGTFGVTLRDDSLTGRGLHEGDRVLVNPMAQPHDNAIVVVNIDDEVFIKIYRKQNKQVSFETTDTAVEPLVMTSDDSYEVIGVAVQKIALL
jgi:SOS-response transcriptional repressor LexA